MRRSVDNSVSKLSERAIRIGRIGKQAREELAFQGILLDKAERHLDQAEENVDQIQMDLRDMESWVSRWKRVVRKCIFKDESKNKIKLKSIEAEDHLPLDQIDRLWYRRYHPQEKFSRQIEAQLDRLIELAEALEMLVGRQERQAERMDVKGKEIVRKMDKANRTVDSLV